MRCMIGAACLGLSACAVDPTLELVKTGSLTSCPGTTMEAMARGFMGQPAWSTVVADDGATYVNLSGDITYEDKPVRATLQFATDTTDDTFELQAIEFNGVPMALLMGVGLLERMCPTVRAEDPAGEPQAEAAPPPPPPAPSTDHWGTFTGSQDGAGVVGITLRVLPTAVLYTEDNGAPYTCRADVPDGVGRRLSVFLDCGMEAALAGVRLGLDLRYDGDAWHVTGTANMNGLRAVLTRQP